MRAICISQPGGPDVLTLGEVPTPVAAEGELLVRVHATALNRADLLQRAGHYPPPPGASPILGLEMAGEVAGWGSGVEGWERGTRVCALLPGGGYAEYVTLPATLALRVPEELSYLDAAAIPETFLTAYQALVFLADAQPGERLLLHAGASGVGTAAIQLARRLGVDVYATASTAKCDDVRALGVRAVYDYTQDDFAARILEDTQGHGADIIIDVIGAPYADAHLRCLALDGRWIVLATMGGGTIEGFELRKLFARRGSIITSTLRSRAVAYKTRLTARFCDEHWEGFRDGSLSPVIDSVYSWRDVAAAHTHMEARQNVGKIVLRVD